MGRLIISGFILIGGFILIFSSTRDGLSCRLDFGTSLISGLSEGLAAGCLFGGIESVAKTAFESLGLLLALTAKGNNAIRHTITNLLYNKAFIVYKNKESLPRAGGKQS